MMICLLEECWNFFLRRFQIFKLHIDIQYSTLKWVISHVDKIIKAQKYKQFWVHFYRLQVIRYSKGTQVYYKNVHWQVYIHFHVFTHCHFPIGSLAYRLNVSYTQDECSFNNIFRQSCSDSCCSWPGALTLCTLSCCGTRISKE